MDDHRQLTNRDVALKQIQLIPNSYLSLVMSTFSNHGVAGW